MVEAISQMTLGEIAGAVALLWAGLSTIIQISPIKLNPWTSIGKAIGRAINGDVLDKLQKQDQAMVDIRDTVDDNEIDRIRWEILDFSNSCRQGKKHTLDEFVHIIELNEKYHKILERRDLTNGRIDLEYNYIVSIYEECQKKNNFL